MNVRQFLRIDPTDTVGVALRDLSAGERMGEISLASSIPTGHKIALHTHAAGDPVIKYGQKIGKAIRPINAGEHVHTHNLATDLAGEIIYRAHTYASSSPQLAIESAPTWLGYRRADGRVATRNEVWVLPTVGCVAQLAEQVARSANERHRGSLDGIFAFSHPHGCSQLGDDLDATRKILLGLALNPNASGVLFLGLGCESNQLTELLSRLPADARDKIRSLTTQDVRDEESAASKLIDELVEKGRIATREEVPLSALSVGLKCGGSDSFSGLTANPLFGRFSNRLAALGGQTLLTEIPEIFGAEESLLNRATSRTVFESAASLINKFKRYFLEQGLPVSENPSPGNIAGGITTLEEKSLGAVQKGGVASLTDVVEYGDLAQRSGLTLLEAPGNDAISSTALIAAGANLLLFSTGRGTPLGFPVPTIKVASNRALAESKPHWIDFDSSGALDSDPELIDAAFMQLVCQIASGQRCQAEVRNQRNIAIWKRGATL